MLEDGSSIVKGRVGSAIVGGMLFGGIGAIAGASRGRDISPVCNSMMIRILTNDFSNAQFFIPLVTSQTKTDSLLYRSAMASAYEITSVLAVIKARAEL